MSALELVIYIGGAAAAFGIWYGGRTPTKCEHPFDGLVITKESTTEYEDEDFSKHRVYLTCLLCNAKLVRGCSTLNGGVDAFLMREQK